MSIKEIAMGVLITIFVKPNSPKFAIRYEEDNICVYATEEPEKGKVNKEIIKELTKLFCAKVTLVSGVTSRHKQVIIEGRKIEVEKMLKKKQK